MRPGVVLLLALAEVVIVVVTVAVLQSNRAYRRRMLDAADAAPRWRGNALAVLDERLRRTGVGSRLAALLAGSGLARWSPTVFVLGVAGAALAAMVISYPLMGRIGSVLIGAVVVASVQRWLRKRQAGRVDEFIAQLPELARLLANGAAAGLAVPRSLQLAAREMDEPAATEIGQVSAELGLGQSLHGALDHLATRLPSRELAVLVQTLVIQNRAGGALVTALTQISSTLEERRQLRREIKTASSGAVFTGYLVIIIGVGAVVVMNVMSPGVLDMMFTSFPGQVVLVVAGLLFAVGYFLIRRLSKVEL